MAEVVTETGTTIVPPGRLGNPERTLGSDPRTDPRLLSTLEAFELTGHAAAPPVSPSSSLDEQLEFCAGAESAFEGLFAALYEQVPPIVGVESETRTITGTDGNEITLYIHRPVGAEGSLPCVYHIHGGGMTLLEAAGPCYRRWRDEMADLGMVVVGVEFRNAAGKHGPHPFPAGLDDCIAGLRWVLDHRDELGVTRVVVQGESGGANLSLAVAISAKRDGWVDRIAGVYGMCPFISGLWGSKPAELPSLHENDGYFLDGGMMAILAEVYDPGGRHADDAACWPYRATTDDLAGLPPHVISVNELDPLRDEGLAYYRKLLAAGVDTVGRTVHGTSHAGDMIFRAAIPDVYAATIRDIYGFVNSLG